MRNKNISFKNNSYIIFDPFFEISSKFQVDNINTQFLKSIDLNKLLISKSFLKKMNIKNEIQFTPKKFNRDLVDNLKLKIDLAYGRMIFSKKFSIDNNFFECGGNLNLLEEYPILFFDCKLNSNNKKNLLKKFSVKTKDKNKFLNLQIKGTINLLNRKINFNKILMDEDYDASEEDLIYFKETFENILFDESFLKIFNKNKIKDFLSEIS